MNFSRCRRTPWVLRDGKLERLVPMVPERLVAVDLGAGKVTVDWHPDD
jgi:ribosomal 30S subunit maturation factor RimM